VYFFPLRGSADRFNHLRCIGSASRHFSICFSMTSSSSSFSDGPLMVFFSGGAGSVLAPVPSGLVKNEPPACALDRFICNKKKHKPTAAIERTKFMYSMIIALLLTRARCSNNSKNRAFGPGQHNPECQWPIQTFNVLLIPVNMPVLTLDQQGRLPDWVNSLCLPG
jgi:hypothetical protein